MGTRNLTCVVKDDEFKVAQYGQWNGYPEGQGATILEYFKRFSIKELERGLVNCYWVTEKDIDQIFEELELPENGWLNMEQAEKYSSAYPSLTRDTGAEILELITMAGKNGETVPLQDSHEFAADSLFCEYAYVIDLDHQVLEVYTGFNNILDEPPGRFGHLPIDDEDKQRQIEVHGYYYRPIVLAAKYPLNVLPTVEQMQHDCDEAEKLYRAEEEAV